MELLDIYLVGVAIIWIAGIIYSVTEWRKMGVRSNNMLITLLFYIGIVIFLTALVSLFSWVSIIALIADEIRVHYRRKQILNGN